MKPGAPDVSDLMAAIFLCLSVASVGLSEALGLSISHLTHDNPHQSHLLPRTQTQLPFTDKPRTPIRDAHSRSSHKELGHNSPDSPSGRSVRRNTRRLQSMPLTADHTDARYDVTTLFQAVENLQKTETNCSSDQTSTFTIQYSLQPGPPFLRHTESAIKAANFLSELFQTLDNSSFRDEYVHAQVRSILDSDQSGMIYGAAIAFEMGQYRNATPFCPYVYRDKRRGVLASEYITQYAGNRSRVYEWFQKQRNNSFSDLIWNKQDSCNRASSSEAHNSVAISDEQGLWHGPYYRCGPDAVWLQTYSVPFFGCDKDSTLRFKGVVKLDFDLSYLDIDQCDNDDVTHNPFANTHKCRESTQCKFMAGRGFRRGSYVCECSHGYYYEGSGLHDNDRPAHFNGTQVEVRYWDKIHHNSLIYDNSFTCVRCAKGCANCTSGAPCFVTYDVMLRGIPLGLQSLCVAVCLILSAVIIRLRRTKVMKTSMWLLLQIIIVGAVLLYATVIVQFIEPSDLTCTLLPWLREVGFAIVYGALILKIYKVLAEFQSRKAHRVLVRDKDLLKYMACIILVVVAYMAAWTAVSLDHMSEGKTMTEHGGTNTGLSFIVCKDRYWDYIIEIGELLFLLVGVYLCYCTRAAPSDYLESRYITWALYNETIMSALFHLSRHFLWLHFHPDYMFLLYFVHCQVTVTITLLLILAPKIWYAHRPPEDDHFRNRAYSSSDVQDNVMPESMKLHVGVSSNGDVDLGEVNLSEMDPEDIRSELKRLYTQLQIYKTKTMRKDNPHISKRRGGRKATHRRFSLQAFHSKHRHHNHSEAPDHEMSRTPEESTNSAEGVAVSMYEESSVGEPRTPIVTFKPGHKAIY